MPPSPRRRALLAALGLALVCGPAAGCGAGSDPAPPATVTAPVTATATAQPSPTASSAAASARPTQTFTPTPTPTPSTAPASIGATAPSWLGTRVLTPSASGYVAPRRTPRALRQRAFTLPDTLPALPGDGYASQIADPAPDEVIARSTWVPGCPVARDALAWVQLTFHGFDGARHTGELLVASSAAKDVVSAFGDLWRSDVALEEMRISTQAEQVAAPTGDGNDTAAFNCRPVRGATTYSQHAYGLAVDINPFQNPYERITAGRGDESRVVLPELATSYLDRDDVRPGMIEPDGPVVRAFARIGWEWGGDYQSLKDYQHFSQTGG